MIYVAAEMRFHGDARHSILLTRLLLWNENENCANTMLAGELAVDRVQVHKIYSGDKWYPNGCKIHPNG